MTAKYSKERVLTKEIVLKLPKKVSSFSAAWSYAAIFIQLGVPHVDTSVEEKNQHSKII